MKVSTSKLLLGQTAMVLFGIGGNSRSSIFVDADRGCGGLNEVSVTCIAANGHTEEQWPKKYGAPVGTDCNEIPTPTNDPKFPHWRECMRTVEFDFHWTYLGSEYPELDIRDAKLLSMHRRIVNSAHEYPEEEVPMVTSYWEADIWKGWSLKDTHKQIVVDLCQKPITYEYSLDVTIQKPDGTVCTDTATYTYSITANESAEKGYAQFKEGFKVRPSPKDVNRTPNAPNTGAGANRAPSVNCNACLSPPGRRATKKCITKVNNCMKRTSKVKKCIRNKMKRYANCCKMQGGTARRAC